MYISIRSNVQILADAFDDIFCRCQNVHERYYLSVCGFTLYMHVRLDFHLIVQPI